MSNVELVVITAEASDGNTIWSNRVAMRTEAWAALEGTGMHETWVRQAEDELRRNIPEGLEVRVSLHREAFQLDDEEEG